MRTQVKTRGSRNRETFVCDACGARQYLARNERHWCANCAPHTVSEMHPVKMKRLKELRDRFAAT